MAGNPILKTRDYLISGREFDLVWDPQRCCLQTVPVPDDLEAFYQSPDYISHSDGATTLMERIYQFARSRNLKRKLRLVERYFKGKGALMDVGAGTGDFVRHAQDHGWESYGVEPNQQARELAHKKGVRVYTSLRAQNKSSYDVVTLWHVLEHFQDLEQGIQEISEVIKPGGWLILALPNYRSMDARYYKSYWAAYDVPRHLWHLSKDSVKKIFLPKGYTLVSIKPLWMDAFYISWLSEKYRNNPLAPVLGFLVGALSNMYGFFFREFSSHVYVLKRDPEAF